LTVGTIGSGGISRTFKSTTRIADITPVAFSFGSATGVALGSTQTSSFITISGLEPNYSFTISASGSAGALVDVAGTAGGYATSKTAMSSGTGTLSVSARVTASGSFGTNTTCNVSVGDSSGSYSVTTVGADTTPDAFSFDSVSGVNPGAFVESPTIVTVSGLNTGTNIAVSNGQYKIGTGNYTTSSGSVVNGNQIRAGNNASSSFNTSVQTTINIGGVLGYFTSTTRAPVVNPNAFAFTDATNALAGTTYTSATITITGLEPNYSPITVSCSNGLVDAGTSTLSGTFAASKAVTTSGTGTIVVATSVVSSSSSGGIAESTVTIGDKSDAYRVTTTTNTMPNIFTFNTVSGVALSTLQTSNTITVSGLGGGSVPVSVTNGQYSKNGGAWNNPGTNTTAVDNDTFAVRHTSAGTNSTNTDTSLLIGARAGSFRSTTLAAAGGVYGIQVFDASGNIMLDISDNTIKDFGTYSIGSVTTNTTITGVPITNNSIALVTNNNGDGDNAIAQPPL